MIDLPQKGDEEGWSKLVMSLSGIVRRVTGRYRLSEDDRADVFQEVFVKLFNNIEKYDPQKASLSTYVAVITRNTCVDALRRQQKLEREIPIEMIDESKVVSNTDGKAEGMDQDERNRLWSHFEKELTPQQRIVLRLKYSEGLSYESITRVLRRDYHWVKNTLYEARKALKRVLETSE